jgi:nitrile hydratase subunit beta
MNGPHDLGGQMGFGPVAPEPVEPVFHAGWERRALGLTLAAGALGRWTLDESRHARESLHPAVYYSSSYYAIWLQALERLLLRHGLVTRAELEGAAAPAEADSPDARLLRDEAVPMALATGAPCNRPADAPPRFAAGAWVRARNMHPKGHTRLPRYARGRVGVVAAVHDAFVLPDSNAHRAGERPERLYTVVFSGPELWGEEADPTLSVSLDAWESYLEPA